MPIPLAILVGLLAIGAALCALYWCIVLYHVIRTAVLVPTLRAGLRTPEPAGGWPSVCVLVPAHNEESCIRIVAESIRRHEYPGRLRAVFVLDRCTDRTRAILDEVFRGDDRAEILELGACPPGWAGKTHALHRGVTDSSGAKSSDILLFIDADTELRDGCVRAAVGLLKARGLAMLSLLSTLTYTRGFEYVSQTAAGMELVRQYPIVRANADRDRRAFANGQFIMLTREAYAQIGGHESIRGEVLEDVALSRRVFAANLRAGLFLAAGLFACRMYANSAEFDRGWKRILSEAAGRKPGRLRRNAWRVRAVGVLLPGLAVAALVSGLTLGPAEDVLLRTALWAGGIGVGSFLAGVLGCYASGRSPLWAMVLYPLGAWRVAGIMSRAAGDLDAGRPTVWAGMAYQAAKRE